MKRVLQQNEFDMFISELNNQGFCNLSNSLSRDTTFINGITVFEVNENAEGLNIRYIEDDIIDDDGNPYLFEYPYLASFGNLKFGNRLIAVYHNGTYSIVPVNGSTFTFVGTVDENKAASVDKSKCILMPSPLVLGLEKNGPRPVQEEDIKEIKEAVQKYAKYQKAGIIGTVALSILSFIIIFLIYIFTAEALMDSDAFNMVIFLLLTVAALALLGFSIYGSIKFFKGIYLRNILKKKYIKKVMFAGFRKDLPISASISAYIGVYEWVNGAVKYNNYSVGVGTYFLDDNIRFGEMIYLLTDNEEFRPMFDSSVIFQIPKIPK